MKTDKSIRQLLDEEKERLRKLPIKEHIKVLLGDFDGEEKYNEARTEMFASEILTAIKETLLQEIPTITRDLTSAPTHGLPKSKSNRILNEAIERVLGKKEI